MASWPGRTTPRDRPWQCGVVSRDDTALFKFADTIECRGRRQTHRGGHSSIRLASVALQFFENMGVDGIELRWRHLFTFLPTQLAFTEQIYPKTLLDRTLYDCCAQQMNIGKDWGLIRCELKDLP